MASACFAPFANAHLNSLLLPVPSLDEDILPVVTLDYKAEL